jgi:hypothetical protein
MGTLRTILNLAARLIARRLSFFERLPVWQSCPNYCNDNEREDEELKPIAL